MQELKKLKQEMEQEKHWVWDKVKRKTYGGLEEVIVLEAIPSSDFHVSTYPNTRVLAQRSQTNVYLLFFKFMCFILLICLLLGKSRRQLFNCLWSVIYISILIP